MGGKTFDYIVSILNNPDWDEEIMDCADFLALSDEDEFDEMVEKKPEYQEVDD